ncbi:MAG: hypothetical protein ACYC91_08830 [Solirubrobacteraceae bacterium]
MRDRETLIARIRQIRRASGIAARAAPEVASEPDTSSVGALQVRVEHLEHLLEALQDSVHRQSERHERRISELEAQIQPEALSVALSRDARERGI